MLFVPLAFHVPYNHFYDPLTLQHHTPTNTMISDTGSVESVLDKLLAEVELWLEREPRSMRTAKRKLGNASASSKRRKLNEPVEKEDVTCRICYESQQQFPAVQPCECKGTMGAVHLRCLERWLEESNRSSCELCGHQFEIRRTPRYRVLKSLAVWFCLDHEHRQIYVRNVRPDLLRCAIVTPVTLACLYVFIVLTDFYARNNYENFPPARWTTYLLLTMLSLLIFSYFVWTYMVMQYHQRVWFYWWQRTSTVNVLLPRENVASRTYNSSVSQI